MNEVVTTLLRREWNMGFNDLCDRCMRSGVEVHRTDENGSTVCVECDADEAAVATLQFDGRRSVIGLEETNQTSGTITFDEIGSAYEITTPHEPYGDFETVAYVMNEGMARLMSSAPEMADMLITLLPYIETAELDESYKPGAIRKLVSQLRELITKATT